MLAFLTLLPLIAWASEEPIFSSADLRIRKNALSEFTEAATYAEEKLGPCDGIDYFGIGTFRYAPEAKSCPKAAEFLSAVEGMFRNAKINCHDASHWIEDALRNRLSCGPERERVLNKAESLQREASRATFTQDNAKEFDEKFRFDDFENPARGSEMANIQCSLAVTVGMQARRRLLALMMKHYGLAIVYLQEGCSNPDVADQYSRFLRYGDSGISH